MMFDSAKTYAFVMAPIVIALGIFFFFRMEQGSEKPPTMRIGDREWSVEIARTDVERAKGLSGRDALCPGCAMIFRFDGEGVRGFWMRGMRFPLDIAWVRAGSIVHVERRVPADFPKTMAPEVSADMVIEVNVGDFDSVSIGDGVSFLE